MVAAEKLRTGSQVLGGVSAVGSGSGEAVSAAASHDASMARADAMELRAQIKKMDALDEEDVAHLKKVLEQMQDQVAEASLMLAGSFQTSKKIFSSV